MKFSIALLPLLVAVSANCSSLHYGGPGQIPGTPDTPGFDGGTAIPSARGGATQAGSSQICRSSPMPRGWIAVDYLSAPASCAPLGGKANPGPNAALIVRYSTLPPETALIVCADQHMPYDWVREPEEPTDASSAQCPRKPGDTRTGSTIVRLRRKPS